MPQSSLPRQLLTFPQWSVCTSIPGLITLHWNCGFVFLYAPLRCKAFWGQSLSFLQIQGLTRYKRNCLINSYWIKEFNNNQEWSIILGSTTCLFSNKDYLSVYVGYIYMNICIDIVCRLDLYADAKNNTLWKK
jgi:hypothetical protein